MDICKNFTNVRGNIESSKEIDEETKEMLIETMDNLLEEIGKYYIVIFDSETARFGFKEDAVDINDYQSRVKEFDTKRRNMHNEIINDIVMIDRFCKNNNMPLLYGKLSDEELKNSNLIKKSSSRRTEVAQDIIKAVGKML